MTNPHPLLKIEIRDGTVFIEDATGFEQFPLAELEAIKHIDAAFLAFRDAARKAKRGARP